MFSRPPAHWSRLNPLLLVESLPLSGLRSSATINTGLTNIMPKSDHKAALAAVEKVLELLRSMHTLEGTDKDGVEHLLEMAVEDLRN